MIPLGFEVLLQCDFLLGNVAWLDEVDSSKLHAIKLHNSGHISTRPITGVTYGWLAPPSKKEPENRSTHQFEQEHRTNGTTNQTAKEL
jgi:hypothetical protein